jgi:hypothetical protein
MKHLSSRLLVAAAAVSGLIALAAPAAHAFTIDDQSNTNASGGARYADPDARFDSSDRRSSTIQQGNATFQFGGGGSTFEQRNNPSRMFDPIGGPGRDGYR